MSPLTHSTPSPQGDAIQLAMVNMFHRRAPAPVIGLNIVFAALLVLLWWDAIAAQSLLLWFGAMGLITTILILRHRRFEREWRAKTADAAAWRRTFVSGSTAFGLVWGAGGILLYSPAAPLQSAIVLLLICGIAAGVASAQASLWPSVVLFTLTAILPPASAILFIGDPTHMVISALLVVYLVYTLAIGRRNYHTMAYSVRLQFENSQLLRDLQAREQHFRSLVENAPDMVLVVGAEGQLLFHNPSTETVLGYGGSALAWHSVFDITHPDDAPLIREKMQQLLATPGTSVSSETRWRHHNGEWRLLQCVARRIGDSEPPLLVVNARDITQRQAMEDELRQTRDAAEQASRVKSQFLATVSHEIRTPMHAILGMAELLQQTPLNAAQQSYVRTFRDAGRHLLHLIDDILDFSRLDAGGLQLADLPFDLGHLLDEIHGLLGAQAQAKGLPLRIEVAPGLPLGRRGDTQRLRQVLVNLIGNAIKFTPQGHVAVSVDSEAGQDGMLRFTISDTGIGIAQDQLASLFAPFSQLDAGHARQQGGTGLGLSICRRLIDAMGGRITVESEPGQGSRFSFTARLPRDTTDTRPAAVAADTPGDLPPVLLLVADDSEMNRLVIKEFLRGTACQVIFADNGLAAVELFGQHDFDLVLMDIQMPHLDGWSATRRIRSQEQHQGRAAVPIVALSASAMEEDRQASLAAGCDDFVAKPLGRSQLLALLQQYLGTVTDTCP